MRTLTVLSLFIILIDDVYVITTTTSSSCCLHACIPFCTMRWSHSVDPGAELDRAHCSAPSAHYDFLHGHYLLLRSMMADDEEELDRLRDELEGMQDVSWSKSLLPRSSSTTNSDAPVSAIQFDLDYENKIDILTG